MTTTEGAVKPALTPFPLRVGTIVPIRIDFEAFTPPAAAKQPEYYDPSEVAFQVQVKYRVDESSGIVVVLAESVFPQEKKGASVDTQEKAGTTTPKPPYRLNVAAAASFDFNPSKTTRDEVTMWCEKGAFFVVSPYLRYLVFDATAKSGFPTVTLPLVLVPVLREKAAPPKDDAPASPV